jgi:membrane protease YdiL (CAAX protease family)
VVGGAAYAAGMAPARRNPVIHPSDQPPPEVPYRPGWVPRRDLAWNGSAPDNQADAGRAPRPPAGQGRRVDAPTPASPRAPTSAGLAGAGDRTHPTPSASASDGLPAPAYPVELPRPARPGWALPAALVAMAVVYPAAFWFRVVPFWSAMVAFSAFSWWAAWHPYLWARLRPSRRLVAMGVLSGLGLYLVFAAGALVVRATPLWPYVQGVAELTRTAAPQGLAALVIVFGTSPSEEVLWRGAVFARMTRRYGAGWRPVIATTAWYAAFVALSGRVVLPLAALVCGAVWARQRQVTGSLVPGLVSHILWSLLMFLYVPGL